MYLCMYVNSTCVFSAPKQACYSSLEGKSVRNAIVCSKVTLLELLNDHVVDGEALVVGVPVEARPHTHRQRRVRLQRREASYHREPLFLVQRTATLLCPRCANHFSLTPALLAVHRHIGLLFVPERELRNALP